jgi:pimeloyl-ACP methyl ester carboxylesterase
MSSPVNIKPHIAYDERAGTGAALLLMSGWCGDRTVFAPMMDEVPAGRRALCLDWRGHGESTRDVPDFGTNDLVADALDVIDRSGAETVIPVALSHAGWVAIELRRRLGPAAIPGIVLVDWMVLGPPPGFADALEGLQGPGWRDVRSALFSMWTTGVSSQAVLDYVASMADYGQVDWSRAGREIAASFAAEGTPLAALEGIAKSGQACPTLHVYAQPDDPAVLAAQQAYAAEHPWFSVARLDAHSHFPMLEVPQDLARAVDAFAAEVTR